MDTASGRYPCDAPSCDQSSCPAIRNNFDATARTFKAPSPIRRADGSDALRQREAKVYSSAYQISNQDREKSQQGASQQQQPSTGQGGEDQQQQQQPSDVTAADPQKKSRRTRPRTQTTTPTYPQQNPDEQGQNQPDPYAPQQPDHEHHYHPGKIQAFSSRVSHDVRKDI